MFAFCFNLRFRFHFRFTTIFSICLVWVWVLVWFELVFLVFLFPFYVHTYITPCAYTEFDVVPQVTKDLERIKRFSAQEALEYGLIDKIVRPSRIKAEAPRKSNSRIGVGSG